MGVFVYLLFFSISNNIIKLLQSFRQLLKVLLLKQLPPNQQKQDWISSPRYFHARAPR